MLETSLIQLYCTIEDIIQVIQKGKSINNVCIHTWNKQKGRKRKLSISEVVCLNIFRYQLKIQDLKTFHTLICSMYKQYFPHMPNYENFVKASNKSFEVIHRVNQYILKMNNIHSGSVFYIDSTKLPVCENIRINKSKVAKDYAQRGKTTTGWFYGFKVHGICSAQGKLLNYSFSKGNVHDSQFIDSVSKSVKGTIIGDAGYLVGQDILSQLYESGRTMLAVPRRNMKRLISFEQFKLVSKRSRIESVWGCLKQHFFLVNCFARSIIGLFRHYFYSIAAFLFKDFDFRPVLFIDY